MHRSGSQVSDQHGSGRREKPPFCNRAPSTRETGRRPAARAALQTEFDITEADADMVLDQQFSLLIHDRLNKL